VILLIWYGITFWTTVCGSRKPAERFPVSDVTTGSILRCEGQRSPGHSVMCWTYAILSLICSRTFATEFAYLR